MRRDIYVFNHATESVEKAGFESRETAEEWADGRDSHLEVVDARPL